MHLFDNQLPFASDAMLRHADATPTLYRGLQQRLGLQRCVIVQPSSYGLDHRVLVAGLSDLGRMARGIAVITPDVHDDDLAMLAAHGVVGVRMNLVQRGATDETMLEAIAERIRPLGWHLQLHLSTPDLLRLTDRLHALDATVVLDHFARVGTQPLVAGSVERNIHGLMAKGSVWLKLSAPYIGSVSEPEYPDLRDFTRRLVQAYPDRLVWGSDWPHVTESTKPDDARLLDQLRGWLSPDEFEQVLVHNPKVLYGFPPSHGPNL